MVKIYHKSGKELEVDSVDAREILGAKDSEYSADPPTGVAKAATDQKATVHAPATPPKLP